MKDMGLWILMAYNDFHRKNYLAPVPYLINHFIYDYDIRKANLNIFYNKGMIDEETFNLISTTFDRNQREMYFGLLQKDKSISDAYGEALAEYRERFITENNIDDMHLLSVKNDAICTIDLPCYNTVFDNGVEFVLKNIYTSYFNINRLEIYYYLDQINNKEVIDIKGINDKKLVLHHGYMLDFLCNIFESIQTELVEDTLKFILDFQKKYINRELPLGFYRELNSDSCYRVSSKNGTQSLWQTWNEKDIGYLNIITNLNIIRHLYSIVSNIYFNRIMKN